MLFLLLTLNFLAFLTVHAAPGDSQLSPPSKDPFYAVPPDIDNVPPGTILRARKNPFPIAAIRNIPVNVESAQQILYKTTDTFNKSTATVLTVFVPHNADKSKVLSYQIAQDSAAPDCAPSFAFSGTIGTQSELLLIEMALEQGWVVISPDHEGPRGAFIANKLAGNAVLDGVRASLQSGNFTGINSSANVALWGYSGGSSATMFAAELQPEYAPELNIVGAAAGGIEANLPEALAAVNGGQLAAIIPTAFLGLANEHPEMKDFINKRLLPDQNATLAKAASQCLDANSKQFASKDVLKMFSDPKTVLDSEPVKTLLKDNSLGARTPKVPMFVYKSINDETDPVKNTDALIKSYCASGASVNYNRDLASNHMTLALTASPKALSWLKDRLNGKTQTGCNTRSMFSTVLDPSTVEFVPKFLTDVLLDFTGRPVGPGSGFFG